MPSYLPMSTRPRVRPAASRRLPDAEEASGATGGRDTRVVRPGDPPARSRRRAGGPGLPGPAAGQGRLHRQPGAERRRAQGARLEPAVGGLLRLRRAARRAARRPQRGAGGRRHRHLRGAGAHRGGLGGDPDAGRRASGGRAALGADRPDLRRRQGDPRPPVRLLDRSRDPGGTGGVARLATPADEERVLYLSAAMYTEEMGENPLARDPSGYRRRVQILTARGWTYVYDFNAPAVALYERLGFQREPYDFQTVILP